jgi:uncharacterized protein YjeT (DUF2065 family)
MEILAIAIAIAIALVLSRLGLALVPTHWTATQNPITDLPQK